MTNNQAAEGVLPRHEQADFFDHLRKGTSGAPKVVEALPEDHPTESHELANAEQGEKGVAQLEHGHTEVRDLGWNEDLSNFPVQLVGGLPNEELWTLIRRFNHVSSFYHSIR